jgi:hypothetical protein
MYRYRKGTSATTGLDIALARDGTLVEYTLALDATGLNITFGSRCNVFSVAIV